jgi:drug/metabolite transporter (DMT)-like permease
MGNQLKAHLAIIGANIIFGLNYTICKDIMPDYMQPLALNLVRVFGGISLFWLTGLFVPSQPIDKKDFKVLILGGLCGIALNQILFLKGLNYTTPIDSAIMMTSNPIIVLLIAFFLLRERISVVKISGMVIGAAGAIVLILFSGKGEVGFDSKTMLGNLMMLGNSAAYGFYLVLIKPIMQKYHPVNVLKWVYVFGSFFMVPFGWTDFADIHWAAIPLNIWFSVAFVVILATYMAFLFNVFALRYVNPTTVSIYIYSQPVIAAIFAISLGKDSLSLIKVCSALLVFTGVYLVSKPNSNGKLTIDNGQLTNNN